MKLPKYDNSKYVKDYKKRNPLKAIIGMVVIILCIVGIAVSFQMGFKLGEKSSDSAWLEYAETVEAELAKNEPKFSDKKLDIKDLIMDMGKIHK
jgi:hypothetical protein